jgi:hypothetical protein
MKRKRKPWNIPAEEIRQKATGTTQPLPVTQRKVTKRRAKRPSLIVPAKNVAARKCCLQYRNRPAIQPEPIESWLSLITPVGSNHKRDVPPWLDDQS